MKILGFFIAEDVLIDQRTNKMSLINVFDNTVANRFPLFIPGLNMVVFSEKEDGDNDSNIIHFVIKLDSRVLFEADANMIFTASSNRNRCILTIGGLLIPEPGVLEIQALLNGNVIGTYITEIIFKNKE